MFLALAHRNEDKLIPNPEFDKNRHDPADLDSPDPQILQRTSVLDKAYIETDFRTVMRNLGVIDHIDYYQIVVGPARGQATMIPIHDVSDINKAGK